MGQTTGEINSNTDTDTGRDVESNDLKVNNKDAYEAAVASGWDPTPVGQDQSRDVSDTNGPDDPEVIQQRIEETRSELSGTINELQQRLNPQHLKDQVTEQVKEQVQEHVQAAKEAVREA